jgi:hypothetical protein
MSLGKSYVAGVGRDMNNLVNELAEFLAYLITGALVISLVQLVGG